MLEMNRYMTQNGLDWLRQTAQSQIVGVESIAENFVGERQSRVKHRRGLMGQTVEYWQKRLIKTVS
ncbi:hypothetical protein [Neisseria sicca]|jgi:hypothetical protein|uniref:hypothetical protein n=1 Tax=Neisseria sicca TaxID=490 RepID=UPI000668E124|nr:hypothetical protein [Neisseria sicca]